MKTRFYARFLAIVLFVAAAYSSASAQQWVDLMLKKDANFFDVQAAFNQEWSGKSYIKGQGYKQFKRWEAFWEYRINPDGTFPSYQAQWNSYKQFVNSTPPQAKAGGGGGAGGNWSPIGPFDHTATDSWSPGHGRINCIMEDPNNSNIIYAGAPAGGIWKTTDGGTTWSALGDDLPVIGVSGIAVDPSNSNTVYISTGDNDGGDTYSIGVWKSTDGGQSWNQTGAINANTTGKIIIDPTNTSTLMVVSSAGVYRSTNSGGSWTNVRTGNYDDIAMKPGDPQIVYATRNNAVWRSTDNGQNWSQVTSGVPTGCSRMKIAVTAANANYVYLLAADGNNSFEGVYRSTNSGQSFSPRNTTTDIFDGSTQAWYDMAIGASQTNADIITTGCLNVWRSTNGGSSFTQLNNWSSPNGAAYTHADIHFLWWYGNNLYCGSDGGIYKSTNNGSSFTDLTPGMQIGQFYTIAGTQQDPTVVCGGLQDNGGFAWNNNSWKCYYGADGMGSAVDPGNPQRIFGMIQYGDLYWSGNGGNSSNGLGSPEQGAWVTPLEADPGGGRLIAGYNDLYEYVFGSGWNQLSNFNFGSLLRNIDIYEGNTDVMYVSTYANIYRTNNDGAAFTNVTSNLSAPSGITSIEIHPTNPDQVWVTIGGNGGGRVYITTNGGQTWQNITGNLPNIQTNIVKHEPGTANGIYIGTDIGVYYRDDALGTWIPYMTNLPNVIVNDLEIHVASSTIRAGSYGRGVWESGTYNQPSVNDDAGISAIDIPNGTICGVTFTPVVTLNNFGTNALTSANINFSIDGGTPVVVPWTGNLAAGASAQVSLPTQVILNGSHTFDVETSDPNGTTDGYIFNDDASSTFNITVGNPVTMTLMTDCWGSETSWELRDGSNNVVYSGGPYADTGGDTIVSNWCLADGCYDFQIFDSYGDGMFGSQWQSCTINGDMTIVDDATGATIGGLLNPDFGNDTTMNFCVLAPVTAAFTSNKTVTCAGLPVNFTDQSIGSPTTWNWTFQGGTPTSSTNQNQAVTYATQGSFDVQLIVSNGSTSDTLLLVDYITVVAPPTGTGQGVDESCAGDCNGQVIGTATGGTSPYTYTWSNGLGNGGTVINVCPGTYNLVITDINGCVASGISATVGAGPAKPNTSFTANPTTVFLDQSGQVDFTNTSTGATSYAWDFDDGNTDTQSDPSHTYTTPGIYDVELTGTNDDNCDSTYVITIEVALSSAIDESVLSNAINLYPNPTTGLLSVEFDADLTGAISVEVFNAIGKRIELQTLQQGQTRIDMDLSTHADGLYYVTVWVGDVSTTRKVSLLR